MACTYAARWMLPRFRRRFAQPVRRLLRKRRAGTPSSESRWRSEKWAILMSFGSGLFEHADSPGHVRGAPEADPRRTLQRRGDVARGAAQPHDAAAVRSAAHDVQAADAGARPRVDLRVGCVVDGVALRVE